jgi:hypothetical protein
MSNAIYSIRPSWEKGVLAFDDPARGLRREPFVAHADTFLRYLSGGKQEFTLLFSDSPFPGHQVRVDRFKEEFGGNWYECRELGFRGWLCPALYRYYETAPESLYLQVV